MKTCALAIAAAAALTATFLPTGQAQAQAVVGYAPLGPVPVAAYYAPAPVVSYRPVVTANPIVATAYYAPAPYYAASPVAYYAAAPVAAPYYVASPVVPAYYGGPYYGRAVVVRPKVYVRGEPVRNVLRAVTP